MMKITPNDLNIQSKNRQLKMIHPQTSILNRKSTRKKTTDTIYRTTVTTLVNTTMVVSTIDSNNTDCDLIDLFNRKRNNFNYNFKSSTKLLFSSLILCLLLFATSIHADSDLSSSSIVGVNVNDDQRLINVKGVKQQSISLPCFIDEDNCGAIYFLTWSRLERSSSISDNSNNLNSNHLNLNNNDQQQHQQHQKWSRIWVYSDDNVNKPLDTLVGRALFTKQKSEARLIINSLRSSDEAIYKCDVTYVAGKCPSLTYVQLNIVSKPTGSYIEHEGERLMNGHHLSLTEGDNLKLLCTVIDARPTPTIVWRSIDSRGQIEELQKSSINDLNNNDTFIVVNNDKITRSTLILNKKLTRDDLGTRYECHIEHETLTDSSDSLDKYVTLDVNVGIKTMEIIGPSTSIREGDVAVIECVAYGSKPAAEIVWRNGSRIIDGKSIQNTIETNIDRITVNSRSKVEIIVNHQDHLNPITCEAANVAMRSPINKSTEISVLFAPIVTMEPQNGVTVNESTSMIKIYCRYKANPNELLLNETVWFKNGRRLNIDDDDKHYMIETESSINSITLVILDITRNDTGHYFCQLSNLFGASQSNQSVFVNVLYPPIVSLAVYPDPHSSNYLLKEGDDLRMICDILDGNPRSATKMRWLKNNGETFSELDGGDGGQAQKELSWLSIPRTLTGNYTCQAFSEAGASDLSNEVEIIVNYPPGKSIIRLLDEPYPIKGHNITLECIVNDLGRPSDHTEYHWENNDGMIFETRQSILTIHNLRIVNRGNISCSAVNEIGFGARGHFELQPYAPPRFINQLPKTIGVNEYFRAQHQQQQNQNSNQLNDPLMDNEYNYKSDNYYSSNDNYNSNNNNNNMNELGHFKSFNDNNDLVQFYCRVECFPICQLQWYRNQQPIDNNTAEFTIYDEILPEEFLLNRFQSIQSILVWNLTSDGRTKLDRKRDSGQIFSCESTGNLVGPSVRSDSIFQVEYAPENLRLSSNKIDVIENEHLPEIRCESDSIPESTYRWISNSFYDKFTGIISDQPTLTLNRSIQRDSAGTYTCIASNKHGEKRIDLQINVLYRPSCTIYESRSGKDNENIVLICEITFANPTNEIQFSWSLNGTELNQTTLNQMLVHDEDHMKSKLIIPSTIDNNDDDDDDDFYGIWTCSARNSVGQTDPNCTLFVDAPIVAESVLNDESLMMISTIIIAIIVIFLFILICLIVIMKRRRRKQHKNDLISQKSHTSSSKLKSNTNGTETEHFESSTTSSMAASPPNIAGGGDMYENMTFHRKPNNCLASNHHPQMNGIASSYYHHHNPILPLNAMMTATAISGANRALSPHQPLPIVSYDNSMKTLQDLTFRRTQSARFPGVSIQPNSIASNNDFNQQNMQQKNIGQVYSIYNDNNNNINQSMYADLKFTKSPLSSSSPSTSSSIQSASKQHSSMHTSAHNAPPPIAPKPSSTTNVVDHHHHLNHTLFQRYPPNQSSNNHKNHTLAQYQQFNHNNNNNQNNSFSSKHQQQISTNSLLYQQLAPMTSTRSLVNQSLIGPRSINGNNQQQQQNNGTSSSSDTTSSSLTPPSVSTSSTNTNITNNATNQFNNVHAYDRPDSMSSKHHSSSYVKHSITDESTSSASSSMHSHHHGQYHRHNPSTMMMMTNGIHKSFDGGGGAGGGGGNFAISNGNHCEYAILQFDHTVVPDSSQC